MTLTNIAFQTDYLIQLVDPEDFGVDPDDAGRLLDSGTATYKTFDSGVDVVLTALEALGQTILSVSSSGLFAVGDRLELVQDDGTFHNSVINAVDPVAGTVTIDDVTTVAAASGNRVRKVFTGPGGVAMTLYGVTPEVGNKLWGYRGALADDGPHQTIGQEFTAEMTLDAGAGLKIIKNLCLKVVAACDL